ncbi:RNA methyltransferase substrate-binding domain-containing protein [Tistrella bauzanensis]
MVAERSEAAGDPKLAALARGRGLDVEAVSRADIDRRFGEDAVHQGIALHLAPCPSVILTRR